MSPEPALVVYTKHDCPLCEEFTLRLKHHRIRFETRDIRENTDWYHRYRERVPVVQLSDGKEVDPPFSDLWLSSLYLVYR